MKQPPQNPLPKDVPDQTFFDFYTPPPGQNAEASSPRIKPQALPSSGRSVSTDEQVFRMPEVRELAVVPEPPPEVLHGFMTESRASEILLDIAQLRPNNAVKKVRVVFKPFRATLYSFKIGKGGVALVKFHVAFRRASDLVIHQAAQIMLLKKFRQSRKDLDRGAYDAFVRALPAGEFELPGARKGRQISVEEPGVHRSLEDSFLRVNAEYFQSQLKQPQLCWSPVKARRILGSYQERNDRLIISRVFDSPRIPLFVLDYLMFHELLHKFLGIGRRNDGKRCMHGADFREIEKKYKFFDQAQAFLKTL